MSNTQLHVPNALDAHMQDVVLTFGITGIVLTASLLLVIAYTAWHPVSRPYLSRVSFRLLVCALISNLIFAATSIPVFSGPSAGCSFMAFFGLSILMFSACMFFCTALNLQLVLVHHLNGNSLEKFYYIGSVAFVAILNVTPYAAGQFGYYYGTCWFSNPNSDVQFRWLLGSQSVWMLLMSTGEVVSFLMHSPRVVSNRSTSFSSIPKPPVVVYRTMILRIGLYPLLSCCLNFTGSILDIWLSKNPIPTEMQWRLSFVDLCVFALRPILYTLLAAGDPGFLSGIRALRSRGKTAHSTGPTLSSTFANSRTQEKSSTTWEAGGNNSHVEQGSAALKPFEEQTVVSHGDAGRERGKPSFVEQDPEQSWSSQEEREVDAGAGAGDIARQI
ncbi:hypothetical protein B0H13DRAFT_2674012 [Mycena leptocephala]|nr:hypothetical protein B0H13DRAFT_2674012 [Mycena leptocephala]